MEIDKKVRVGELYYWRIVAPEAQEAQLSVMYTDTQEYQAPENQYITLGEEQYGNETSQSVSQYVYKVHPDKAVVIGKYWIFFVLIWILCMEAADRVIAGRVS